VNYSVQEWKKIFASGNKLRVRGQVEEKRKVNAKTVRDVHGKLHR
jgi:hypothetical protein